MPSDLQIDPPALDYPKQDTSQTTLAFPWLGGALLVVGCVAYLILFQSATLWSRGIPLPGGTDGPFGALRGLFPSDWLQAPRNSSLGQLNIIIYLLIIAALFFVYWLTLKHSFRSYIRSKTPSTSSVTHNRHFLRPILLITALALFILLWMPGTQSADLHSYIWYGRILTTYGDNPFIHVPLEYASRDMGDWLQHVYWKEIPSVYGPVWTLLAGAVAWVGNLAGGSEMWPHLLGHKLLASAAHLANTALIWSVSGLAVRRFTNQSDLRPRITATLVYAWCPLALIEFGGNGHNDALMLTGILTALYLHLTGRWRLAAFAFALAALIKVAALLFLPGYLFLLFWKPPLKATPPLNIDTPTQAHPKPKLWLRLAPVLQALLIFAATWFLFYLPFWEGFGTLRPLVDGPVSNRFTNSLAAMLRYNGGEWIHTLASVNSWSALEQQSVDALRGSLELPLKLVAIGVSAPVIAISLWRVRLFPRMLESWGWLLFIYLTVAAVWFWPWYVTWLLPIIALIGPGRLFTASQILLATSLLLYAVYPLIPLHLENLLYYRALLIFLPPLAYLLFSLLLTASPNKPRLQPV